MRIVLFGAGASHGSEEHVRVPPLGSHLFDELAAFAPATWGMLSPSWATRFRADFEQAMSDFIASRAFAAPLQWDMAEYFFRLFSATRSRAYVDLLKHMRESVSDLLFATLNYESLLFQARELAGIPVVDLKVCLPHGSSILMCEGVSATAGKVRFTGGVSISGKVRPFSGWSEFLAQKSSNAFPPVMSYYEPNKFTVSGASFIRRQRDQFKEAVLSADRIALIGVRVHTIDEHIWAPLAKTNAELMYASGSSAATSFRNWSMSHGRSRDIAVPKYFRDAIPKVVEFLS